MNRVSYLVYQYPQLSESYASTEMRHVCDDFELDIISRLEPDCPGTAEHPYVTISDEATIRAHIRSFDPAIIHTHWLGAHLGLVCRLSRNLGVPFTVRAHSFDVLWRKPVARWYQKSSRVKDTSKAIARNLKYLNSELCLGILTFPFSIDRLLQAGISSEKIIPCWPVVDYQRFHDESGNTPGNVMNGGAALPKKDFPAYLELASKVPNRNFDLYPIGYDADRLGETNERLGSPAAIHDVVPYKEMPGIYKDHEWLVYTAAPQVGTVGWPVAVAEAQASGVGVCMPNLRPDIHDYVGPAGFVYDSLDEAAEIISQPYPDSMRNAGFEHARRSDIRAHAHLLTDLWRSAC
jgi:hypothetical protein